MFKKIINLIEVTKTMLIKPANVNKYPDLQNLAKELCIQDNHIDGILVLCPSNDENQFFLTEFASDKIEGVDVEAFGGEVLKILKEAEELFVIKKDSFQAGSIRTIIYEFDSLVFVVYNVRGESIKDVYLVLLNTSKKDLGSFNANRSQVRAKMEVAIKKTGLLF